MDQGQNYNRGDFLGTLSACWTVLGWEGTDLVCFSFTVSCVLFCLNSVELQMLHENGQPLRYFRIQFLVSQSIRLFAYTLS